MRLWKQELRLLECWRAFGARRDWGMERDCREESESWALSWAPWALLTHPSEGPRQGDWEGADFRGMKTLLPLPHSEFPNTVPAAEGCPATPGTATRRGGLVTPPPTRGLGSEPVRVLLFQASSPHVFIC